MCCRVKMRVAIKSTIVQFYIIPSWSKWFKPHASSSYKIKTKLVRL